MKKYHVLKGILLMAMLIFIPLTGCASGDGSSNNRRKGPPPEAITACEGKQVGDSVEFTGRHGETLEATCQEIDGQLAAAPEGRPPEGGRN